MESVYVPSTLKEGYFADLPVPGAGDDARPITYNHATLSFVYSAAFATAANLTTHAALTTGAHGMTAFGAGLVAAVDATAGRSALALGTMAVEAAASYLAASGATVGATSQRQVFTNGITGPSWRPASDTATALQMQDAAGTAVVTVDTTNSRVGVNTANPGYDLDVQGGLRITGNLNFGGDAFAILLGGPGALRGRIAQTGDIGAANYNAFFEGSTLKWGYGYGGAGATPNGSFFISRSTIANSDIIITSAGLIGFGTVAPNSKVDVVGTVQADGLRLDVTPTAETPVMTHTITFSANGTNYKIPCVAA